MLRQMYEACMDFLYPPRCPGCGCYCDHQGDWCRACLEKAAHCHALPIRGRAWQYLLGVQAAGRYRGGTKKLIQQLKYQKKLAAVAYIQTFLNASIDPKAFSFVDYVIPVPLYPGKERARGFNQTEKIFAPWAKQQGFLWLDALSRIKETLPQYELDLQARQRNMKNAFVLKSGADVKGKRVLLVDDIFTTGATMEACASVLKKNGAVRIEGLVLASDSQ